MKIHFYGTGASEGFPALFCECESCQQARRSGGKDIRTRSSLQIDDSVLIDFSPDTFAHTIHDGLRLTEINNLLITHSHPDHFYPMDVANVLMPMARTHEGRRLQVYGNRRIGEVLNSILLNNSESEKKIIFNELHSFQKVQMDDYEVTPLRADHMRNEECFIYSISKSGKRVLCSFDTAMFSEEVWAAISESYFDCVILDCTSIDKDSYFSGHMGFGENVKIKERMLKQKNAGEKTIFIATHFAHSFAPFHERLSKLFMSDGFIPAYDGLEIMI